MFWQRSFEGEVFIDHRASPGLDEATARLAGYDPALCGEGKLLESATLICSHCRLRQLKNPFRERPRGMCLKCSNHYVCDFCFAEMQQPDYIHKPYEAKIEEILKWLSVPSQLPLLTSPPQPLAPLPLRASTQP